MTRTGHRAGTQTAPFSARRSSLTRLLSFAVVALLGALAGCNGLDARKAVQEGNFEYKEGRFEKAKELFELALQKEPGLEIAVHNLGLTCAKLFKAGVETPENTAYADCAALHIQEYLKKHPKENKLRDKMTSIWLNGGLYDRAIEYWQSQFAVIPQDEGAELQKREITNRIAGIYFKSGKWREAMEWFDKAAELAPTPADKVSTYQAIGNVSWGVMRNREKSYGTERIEAADRGLAALHKAAELDPKKVDVRALIAALYNFRALAQGSAWAASIERATAQDHDRRRRVLSDEAKKAAAAAEAAAGTPQPAEPANSGG